MVQAVMCVGTMRPFKLRDVLVRSCGLQNERWCFYLKISSGSDGFPIGNRFPNTNN